MRGRGGSVRTRTRTTGFHADAAGRLAGGRGRPVPTGTRTAAWHADANTVSDNNTYVDTIGKYINVNIETEINK